MYLVNVFDNDVIVDQRVLTAMESIDYVINVDSSLRAMITKITKALSVDDNGIIVC